MKIFMASVLLFLVWLTGGLFMVRLAAHGWTSPLVLIPLGVYTLWGGWSVARTFVREAE